MFFILSKLLDFLLELHYLTLMLVVGAGILRLLHKWYRLQRGLIISAVLVLWIFSTGSVANLLLSPLETRYSRPAHLAEPPGAIVMLTGITKNERYGPSPNYELTDGADRIVEAIRLAHLYPQAMLIISGGSSSVLYTGDRESDTLGWLAHELGIPKKRIILDRNSRNTHENAVETHKILARIRVNGPVLLVTSAFHMPRSVACFNKVGEHPIPWPVDYYRTDSGVGSAWLPKPQSLMRSNTAIHEYIGLLFYKLAGYI